MYKLLIIILPMMFVPLIYYSVKSYCIFENCLECFSVAMLYVQMLCYFKGLFIENSKLKVLHDLIN